MMPSDGPAPPLPLLEHVSTLQATDWLRASMTTFAQSVGSVLPGHFESYARVYHPFQYNDGNTTEAPTWRELAAAAGVDLNDAGVFDSLRASVEPHAYVDIGSLPRALSDLLVAHLAPATSTPDRCFFAVWEGFGASAVPRTVAPTLELPERRYHVFSGPAAGARTSFSVISFHHQSANLWWPADHAWCVATEVDLSWTYIGGARACIQSLLADGRIDAVETKATAKAG